MALSPPAEDLVLRFKVSVVDNLPDESVHVVGNNADLGDWKPCEKNKMRPFLVESWYVKIKLENKASVAKDIEYKYVRVRKNGDNLEIVEWERGPNRKIIANELIKCGRVSSEDEWSRRKVSIRYLEESEENTELYSLHLFGDIPPLGSLNMNFKKMKLVIKKIFDKLQTLWEYTFYVDVDIDHFYYTYVRFFRKKKMVFFDRYRYREFVLEQATTELKAREMKNALYLRNNTYYKIDTRIDTDMNIQQLDTNIFFGPYPQLSEDYRAIFELDVKTVVNLMTRQEMNLSLIDRTTMEKKSAQCNLSYQALDYDHWLPYPDRLERLKFIAQKIHQMLLRNETIYICELTGYYKTQELLKQLVKEHLPMKAQLLQQHRCLQ
jgi:hypothetical protein